MGGGFSSLQNLLNVIGNKLILIKYVLGCLLDLKKLRTAIERFQIKCLVTF